MEKIPTAEELLANNIDGLRDIIDDEDLFIFYKGVVCEFAKELTKIHVELALEEASEKADMLGQTQHNNNAKDIYTSFVYVCNPIGADYGYTVNKN